MSWNYLWVSVVCCVGHEWVGGRLFLFSAWCTDNCIVLNVLWILSFPISYTISALQFFEYLKGVLSKNFVHSSQDPLQGRGQWWNTLWFHGQVNGWFCNTFMQSWTPWLISSFFCRLLKYFLTSFSGVSLKLSNPWSFLAGEGTWQRVSAVNCEVSKFNRCVVMVVI